MNQIPFTYLIGWSQLDRWYFGVRYAKNCHPDELWKTYFTSSAHVKKFRQEHGEPDVVEVRHLFSDVVSARKWEHRVLRRLHVERNERFINKSSRQARCNEGKLNGMFGKSHAVTSKSKMKQSWAKRTDHTNMARAGENHPMWGKHQKQNVVEALLKVNLGSTKSADTKSKISASMTGRKWWNNGSIAKLSIESPGNGWLQGRL